jgi:hypothetical protein
MSQARNGTNRARLAPGLGAPLLPRRRPQRTVKMPNGIQCVETMPKRIAGYRLVETVPKPEPNGWHPCSISNPFLNADNARYASGRSPLGAPAHVATGGL